MNIAQTMPQSKQALKTDALKKPPTTKPTSSKHIHFDGEPNGTLLVDIIPRSESQDSQPVLRQLSPEPYHLTSF